MKLKMILAYGGPFLKRTVIETKESLALESL